MKYTDKEQAIKSMIDLYNILIKDCDEINKRIEIINSSKKFVIIYENKNDNEFWYGVTKSDNNKIGEISDILPTPTISIIREFTEKKAISYLSKIRSIMNGEFTSYTGRVISYADYLNLLLKYRLDSREFIRNRLKEIDSAIIV